jgi:hypothetical protein
VEDISSRTTSTGLRYPLQIDPWFGGRYLDSRFDNGIILYPSQEVSVNVDLKSDDFIIYLYLFCENKTQERPVLLITCNDKAEKKILIDKFSWGEYIKIRSWAPLRFKKLTFKNVTPISPADNPESYGIVIDKIIFKYL